jgi:uncharacterized protein (DUF305 family)
MNICNPGKLLLVLVVGAALAGGVAACGEDDATTGTEGAAPGGNGVDRAFATAMIPHHRSAVDMAEVAQVESIRDDIKQLAAAIISSQTEEIDQLETLDQRLRDAGVEEGELGLAENEMGMEHDASMLVGAQPFDREFIDMMIPHHQGAIRMARVELAEGESPELKQLARAIVEAQAKEIDQMKLWRTKWFGAVSPAGGGPADGHGDHSGHGG